MMIVNQYSQALCSSGDFDNDSLNDLVFIHNGGTNSIWMYRQQAGQLNYIDTISLSRPVFSLAIGDINNDGLTDLILGSDDSLRIYLQDDTAGFFNENNYISWDLNGHTHGIAIGDLNNDSLNDVVVASNNDTIVRVYYQLPGFSFNSVEYYKRYGGDNDIIISDINNDGLNDLIVSNGTYSSSNFGGNTFTFIIYLQDSLNNLESPLFFANYPYDCMFNLTGGIDVADLNNDGLKDIVTTTSDSLYIWYMYSINPYVISAPVKISSYVNASTVNIVDLNNDLSPEIVTAHDGYERIAVYERDSSNSYLNYNLYHIWCSTHGEPSKITYEDISNDGFIDVVATYLFGVSILYNNPFIDVDEVPANKLLINIFPNPSNTNIVNLSSEEDVRWYIYDVYGKEITSGKSLAGSQQISLGNIKSGIYLINFLYSDGVRIASALVLTIN